jgi:hypothetical protein
MQKKQFIQSVLKNNNFLNEIVNKSNFIPINHFLAIYGNFTVSTIQINWSTRLENEIGLGCTKLSKDEVIELLNYELQEISIYEV